MVPSSVLVYIQMAEFLMLVMFISWMYSTFFFLPLCAAIGPTDYIGQLTCQNSPKPKQKPSHCSQIEIGTVAHTSSIIAEDIIHDQHAISI